MIWKRMGQQERSIRELDKRLPKSLLRRLPGPSTARGDGKHVPLSPGLVAEEALTYNTERRQKMSPWAVRKVGMCPEQLVSCGVLQSSLVINGTILHVSNKQEIASYVISLFQARRWKRDNGRRFTAHWEVLSEWDKGKKKESRVGVFLRTLWL